MGVRDLKFRVVIGGFFFKNFYIVYMKYTQIHIFYMYSLKLHLLISMSEWRKAIGVFLKFDILIHYKEFQNHSDFTIVLIS